MRRITCAFQCLRGLGAPLAPISVSPWPWPRGRTLVLLLLAGGALVATPVGAAPPSRAFVLDAGAHALVALDLASGKRIGVVPLAGNPSRMNQSDDGRYVVVLDKGPGEDKDERGYQATGRSSATIVDTEGLKVVGRVELGFGLNSVLTDAEGRLVVLCPGYDAKNPKESLPRELVIVDLATARETGRLVLEPGTDLTWQSRDGRTLALLQGLPRTSKYPYPKAKITLVDAMGPSVAGTLEAGGWTFATRDRDRLYLMDYGRPDKDPKKNKNGTVDVVSFADRRVQQVDLGRSPIGAMLMEAGAMAVTSEGPAGGSAGELRLLREGKLEATLPVAARPTYLGEQAGALFVVGAKAVTRVDPVGLQVTATIPLVKGTEAVVGDDDRPFELVVTPDGRRAFIHYPAQDKVAVLDLESGKAIGATKTGRGGKKFMNSMGSGLSYGFTDRIYFYNAGDPPQMQVRPDGRFAYALNLDTSDVTVVDGDTAQAVEKVGADGRELVLLGGVTVVVVGRELNFIDTTRNVKLDPVGLPGLRGLLRSPDGAFAVALAERTVLILDGATGKERARLTDFVDPMRIAFGKTVATAGATPP